MTAYRPPRPADPPPRFCHRRALGLTPSSCLMRCALAKFRLDGALHVCDCHRMRRLVSRSLSTNRHESATIDRDRGSGHGAAMVADTSAHTLTAARRALVIIGSVSLFLTGA